MIQATQNHAFTVLRTEQQLGYLVWTGTRSDFGVKHLRVLIQSVDYDPEEVERRVEAWAASLETYLSDLTDDEFAEFRDALIGTKLEKDKSLKYGLLTSR